MLERKTLANAIRALSMDAVQQANSGHPGAPLGMADMAEVLWNDFLKHNPADPKWVNRDRFVLSNGHASMLIYSLLHLSGYCLSIEDLRQFRQLHSKTPGHPEFGYSPGIETTTGPLGQGLANAVGMAVAERTLAAQFNRDNYPIVDHFTYCFLGDGCLMEGISHEVCSLAGTLGLGKLTAFYDYNGISIDGEIDGWFNDDSASRFRAYGWQVIESIDGHDPEAIKSAVQAAHDETTKPSLIICKTTIGWGSPNKEGSESCHGAPLGEEEIVLVRERLDWPHPPFEIPEQIYRAWDAKSRGIEAQGEWQQRFDAYRGDYPELAAEFERRMCAQLPEDWQQQTSKLIAQVDQKAEKIATRKASQNTLESLGRILPELFGGSADLAGSNLTLWSGSRGIQEDPAGNYIYYGVREFGMSAIMNGIALHGGFKPYGATFLMFSEYARNALRMAALMNVPSIFVYTHDSIGLGEDGPTHQAVEQTATLRMMPRMSVWRPCDGVESAVAWKVACERERGPISLLFSRQGLPHMPRSPQQLASIEYGAYILSEADGDPDAIIIATGSEVELAVKAQQALSDSRIQVRVVSMPSADTFDAQSAEYRESVLPSSIRRRIAIEAGISDYWRKYVGLDGAVIGIDTYGESGPAAEVFEHFGFTVEHVVDAVCELLADSQ